MSDVPDKCVTITSAEETLASSLGQITIDEDKASVSSSENDTVDGLIKKLFTACVMPKGAADIVIEDVTTTDAPVKRTLRENIYEEYPTKPKKGRCIIFNQRRFDPRTGQNERHGTDKDRDNIEILFRDVLKFTVTKYNDLPLKKLLGQLWEERQNADLVNYGCLVVVMLSHGYDNKIFAYDQEFDVDWLVTPFKGDFCPQMAGKPKLYFLQACRGDYFDQGVSTLRTESIGRYDELTLPIEADILIAYSTVSGYFSWRNNQDGSWFIRKLCEVIRSNYEKYDLVSMLTVVNRLVSVEFASRTGVKGSDDMKQIPSFVSQLTKKVFFR